jgi:alkylhydroperoxidase family enzyme
VREPEDIAAMLRYVERVTRAPGSVRQDDVDALRAAGFDSRAVHDICVLAAYFAFVNRTADGLGVVLEDHPEDGTGRG